MRRVFIGIAIAIVAIIIALFVAVSLIDVNKFRPQIQAELESKLNRPVTLGQMHLHIFPLSIEVDGITIGEPAGFPANPPFVQAKKVAASASVTSLFGGNPQIRDLTLNQPQVELIQNTQGVWNFSNIGSAPAPKQAGTTAKQSSRSPQKAPASKSAARNFTLNRLKITDGQVAVTNERTKSPRAVYNHIDVTLTNFAPGKQFSIAADIHFPGPGTELLSFNGTGGPLATTPGQTTPLNGRLSLQQISLASLNSIAPDAIPAHTDASMSGSAVIVSENKVVTCKGDLTLSNPTFQGAKVNYPILAKYNIALNPNDQIAIRSGTVTIGPSVITVSGNINSGATPAAIDLHLGTKNASIANLLEVASAFGVASDSGQIKGTISADLTATGSVKNPQLQGNIDAPHLEAQEIALTNVHAACKMNNGIVQLSPVTTGIFGGEGNGTIALNTKTPEPLASVDARLTGVDVNALLSAFSSVKNTLDGKLAAQGKLNFALASSANLASTLGGTLNFDVTNGHLKNVNILGELARVGKFLNAAPLQSAAGTNLKHLGGTFNINRGIAQTNNLTATLDQGSLSAKGILNLVNNTVDMHMTAVLASNISQAVGGKGIGGFLNTALANNKGELVLPVLVKGSMSHPVFAPDMQAIAEMKMKHLLPTTQNPGGILGSILGAAAGQKSGQKNNNQQNPLNSLFNALKKKH